MNKLIIIAALVATCLAIPQETNNGDDFGFAIYDIPLAEIDASSISEKRDTDSEARSLSADDSIDENDLLRIQAVNGLAEISRDVRSTNSSASPKKLGLKDLIGRTSG
ncbi:uncharacterized protein LOC129910969 [Episyrphus balteatus]|uniref:uncharacterized protein LOC129910969 n=1 Tax=Episyrphus balteatus TaxID=286459 RepID=UPI00248649F1|nr:uncharacterized protein LOC129910969 [Episyrphus balteatus]